MGKTKNRRRLIQQLTQNISALITAQCNGSGPSTKDLNRLIEARAVLIQSQQRADKWGDS